MKKHKHIFIHTGGGCDLRTGKCDDTFECKICKEKVEYTGLTIEQHQNYKEVLEDLNN